MDENSMEGKLYIQKLNLELIDEEFSVQNSFWFYQIKNKTIYYEKSKLGSINSNQCEWINDSYEINIKDVNYIFEILIKSSSDNQNFIQESVVKLDQTKLQLDITNKQIKTISMNVQLDQNKKAILEIQYQFQSSYVVNVKYEPFRRNLNLQLILDHQQATKIGQNNISSIESCKCQKPNQPLKFSQSVEDIKFLGPGHVLFYKFLSMCCIILLFLFTFIGIYQTYVSYNGKQCQQQNQQFAKSIGIQEYCQLKTIQKLSVLNEFDPIHEQNFDYIAIAGIIGIYILINIFDDYHEEEVVQYDQEYVEPSDFTICVENLPFNINKQQIKEIFSESIKGKQMEIANICMAYRCDELKNKRIELQKLQNQKTLLCSKYYNNKIAKLKNQIDENDDQIQKIIEDIEMKEKNDMTIFTGTCFVSFQTEEQLERTLDKWSEKKWYEKLYMYFYNVYYFQQDFQEGCQEKDINQQNKLDDQFKDKKQNLQKYVTIQRAYQPREIIWENLHFSDYYRFKQQIYVEILTILTLFISSFLIFLVNYGEIYYNQNFPNEQNNNVENVIKILVISIIGFMNYMLKIIITKFTDSEKHKSYTAYNQVFSLRLGIAQAMNTGLVTLVIKKISYTYANSEGGLIDTIFVILLSNSITPWIMVLFGDIEYYNKIILQKQIINKIKNNQTNSIFYTQEQAHAIFEGSQIKIGLKYADAIKTMLLTTFYMPYIPFVAIFGMINIIGYYYADKYITFTRKSKRTPVLGHQLSQDFISNFLPLLILSFTAGTIVSYSDKIHHNQILQYSQSKNVLIFLSIFCYVFPLTKIVDYFQKSSEKDFSDERYSDIELTFASNYDRCNPVTTKQAIQRLQKRKENADLKQKQQDKITNKQVNNQSIQGNNQYEKEYHFKDLKIKHYYQIYPEEL